MPARKPRQRIEIDALFAPLPQDLILDKRISAPAVRLWGVLYVFRWNSQAPDFDRLATAMGTTERSIYRWLQELAEAGWIDWDRHAALADRFTLRTAPGGAELTPVSKPSSLELIPGSDELIPGSERLTQVSILDDFPGVLTPQTGPSQKIQNHEKIQNGGGGGANLIEQLIARGIGATTAQEIADKQLDPDAVIQSLDNMLTDGMERGHDMDKVRGRFVTRLRLAPPEKGHPYGRQFRTRAGPGPADARTHTDGAPNPERPPIRRTLDY